jgi:hypothetical protein
VEMASPLQARLQSRHNTQTKFRMCNGSRSRFQQYS